MNTLSTLRLFNGVIVNNDYKYGIEQIPQLHKKTIHKGYIISPLIYANFSDIDIIGLQQLIKENILVSYENWNNSFYKSWFKLKSLSDFELKRDQILHYLTTYGFEAIGVDSDFVYIPKGKIDLPELKEDISFLYIKAFTEKEIINKLDKLMFSGIALKPETQEDIFDIIKELDYDIIYPIMLRCKNKELNTKFAIEFNIVPKNATEFLRYIIQLSTGNSLIIKNKETINVIKEGKNSKQILEAFNNYIQVYFNLISLAESFHRYKPLWLAFKSYSDLKPVINKISKLAIKHHKPMKSDLLNDITQVLNREKGFIFGSLLKEALEKASSFRKIRLLYALQNMGNRNEEVVYKIRNGKSYATTRDLSKFDETNLNLVKKEIYSSIIDDLKKKMEGKMIYLDPNIHYALPATEKQFVGNFPSGTSVEIDPIYNMVIGVHWTNQEERVDLDLSLIDISGTKFGWDGIYRSNSVMFSGDLTDAPKPKGASEFYYFKGIQNGSFLIQLNFFNPYDTLEDQNDETEVSFDIIIGQSTVTQIDENYMINPNEIKLLTNSSIGIQQKVLGVVHIENGKSVFFFSESKVGNLSSAKNSEATSIQRIFIVNSLKNTIGFEDVLLDAKAIITHNKDHIKDCDYNFSIEAISKDTILELFY